MGWGGVAVSSTLPSSLLPASLVRAEVGYTSQSSAESVQNAAMHASSSNLFVCDCRCIRGAGELACSGVDITVFSMLPFFLLPALLMEAEVSCTSQVSAEPGWDASILSSGTRFSAWCLATESSIAPFREHCSWSGALADPSKGLPSSSLLSGGTPHLAVSSREFGPHCVRSHFSSPCMGCHDARLAIAVW